MTRTEAVQVIVDILNKGPKVSAFIDRTMLAHAILYRLEQDGMFSPTDRGWEPERTDED